MKLLSLEIGEQFRSLHPGFHVNFHKLTDKGMESMLEFRPFCFAGLNGKGKSNVLEALAAIFYHLEMCVAKYRPDSFEKHFRRNTCTPDSFIIKYLISSKGLESLLNNTEEVRSYTNIVTISKVKGEDPLMELHPFKEPGNIRTFELIPFEDSKGKATSKVFLPDIVVGYSSGENEILSHPFIKSRLIHFDEYKESINKRPFSEPETSLIYIDEEMSQAVLLACLLFEDPGTTLKPLYDELGIVGIQSFRMNINLIKTGFPEKKDSSLIRMEPLLDHLNNKIDLIKSCSSSFYYSKKGKKSFKGDPEADRLVLDFFTQDDQEKNNNSKDQIRKKFKTAFDFFRFFQTLYELNNNLVSDSVKEEVYGSQGVYTEGKLPLAGPAERAFHFLDFMILKDEGGEKPSARLLRELSDGEHQFLHTMGICLMLKDRRTLLLLDEPETHFNPKWRAEFIRMLNNSIKSGGSNNFLKDVFLTSHSPFIISDCMPDNVLFFTRNGNQLLEAKKASELGLKTYGSSVDYILKNFFETDLISSKSLGELKDIIDHGAIDDLRKAVDSFGESSQKQFLFKKIYEKMEKKDDN
ncbi:restriction system-associated AAA family ATPase [uncultured Draconibacterium sp.]|uniref:restriction system-associated AAA family ATPase n=1 Tax=uncultured Draconibacterium sp. TaxID=1573823 RepID=UPI002AA6390D|nr:restriction system-associated AAA family ATPase [uncultured Draconibacterium sp.]